MQDEGDKVIVCERGDLVFVFNFNPSQSFTDYKVGCKNSGSYKVIYTHTHWTGIAWPHKGCVRVPCHMLYIDRTREAFCRCVMIVACTPVHD